MQVSTLPDDIEELKKITLKSLDRFNEIKQRNHFLEEEVRRLRQVIFGSKSEKQKFTDDAQGRIFDEPETIVSEEKVDVTTVKSHARKRTGRKPLPKDLPRIKIIHDISPEEKMCACGCELSQIGEEVSEKLRIIPEQIEVERHIRPKYACKGCEGTQDESKPTIRIATPPKQLIPKSLVTESLLAYLLTRKYVYAMPFYRIATLLKSLGIEISRTNMARWTLQSYYLVNRMYKLMLHEMRSGPLIGLDETRVQVLKEINRKATSQSFMWVARGGPADHPVIMFRYRRGRSTKFLRRILKGYTGVIQTDGYKSYDDLARYLQVTHAGCWDHARRKFVELTKVSSRAKVAQIALSKLSQLYEVESQARSENLSATDLKDLRQRVSKPIINDFKKFIDQKANTAPQSPLGKAISYVRNEWSKLTSFLIDGNIHLSNILVENAIRPFVLGRKNWLFSDTTRGARASSAIYSISETAKANGLDPYYYFRFLFSNILDADTDEKLKKLMPNRVVKQKIEEFFEKKKCS